MGLIVEIEIINIGRRVEVKKDLNREVHESRCNEGHHVPANDVV